MESISYLYLLIIVLCWTFNPFIKKIILKSQKLNLDEYFVINHIVVTVLLGGYFLYLLKEKKCSPNCFANLNSIDYIYILLGALTSVLGARLMISIIKNEDISFLVANIHPMIIGLSFVIGYMFFSENITISRIIGVTLIILGLIFMNRK
jgi:uncharacterized membrane protein